MGSFQQFLNEQQFEPRTLVRLSHQLERHTEEDRRLAQQRSDKRRDKEKQARSYTELKLGKPRSGRGVSEQQVTAALADKPLPTRVRGKLVRAVNALLVKKGGAPVDAQALFGKAS